MAPEHYLLKEQEGVSALGRRIAEGRQAEVYLWGDTQVIKLFRDQRPRSWIEYEASTARAIQATGLSVPAVGDIVEVGGRLGLIYDRVEGRPMVELMLAKPWTIGRYARLLAELQADVHRVCGPAELPSQRERFRWRLERGGDLPARVQQAALAALEELPDGEALCHADFHHNNVLMTEKGPVIIDWNYSARGDPASDIAWTWILMATGGAPWWAEPLLYWLCTAYLRRSLELHPVDPRQLRRWVAVAAAARLCEDILSGERWALRLAEEGLLR
jgi:uncharacterized protein (TIGR02172 family)